MTLIPEHFITPKKTPCSLAISPIPPFSPPHPSPWQPLIYFFCLYLPILDIYVNGTLQYVAFCVRLLSLSIMFSRFIHVVACINTFYCQIIFYYTVIPHFIHSSVDGYLTCFYLSAIINNAAMNILLGRHRGVGLLGLPGFYRIQGKDSLVKEFPA